MFRFISFLLIATILAPSFALAQSASLRVLESETRFVLNGENSQVILSVENPAGVSDAKIKTEILAPDDSVAAAVNVTKRIAGGRQTLLVPIAVPASFSANDTLRWYRLRYEVSTSAETVSGVVSLSKILPEVFDLEIVTSEGAPDETLRVRVRAIDTANNTPVGGVRIEGKLGDGSEPESVSASATTAADGFTLLEFQPLRNATDNDLSLNIIGSKNGLRREVTAELYRPRRNQSTIVTDKTLYQPGQTVNLRLYESNTGGKPLVNRERSIEIENDISDEVVFSKSLTTSRFGVAATAWQIPENAVSGDYSIKIQEEDGDIVGRAEFRITRYELPNFAVEAKPDRRFYQAENPRARVTVNAKYLFGKPLPQAEVKITPIGGEDDDLTEITGRLDDEGKFTAEIDLADVFDDVEFSEDRQFFDQRFLVSVTDPTTNKTEPGAFDLRLTGQPIHIYLNGQRSARSTRLPNDFYVTTFYADGSPAMCDVEMYELFDTNSEGKNIDPEIGRSLAKLKTNRYGVGKIRLPASFSSDDLDVKLIAKDSRNLSSSLETELEFDDRASLRVTTDKIAYRKGEPMKVSVTSSEASGLVYVDALRGTELVHAGSATLKDGRAEIVVPYNENFQNQLTVAAYSTGRERRNVATLGVIYPFPREIELAAKTTKDTFKPGENVAVRISSRRADRKLGETLLGVLVIDKAVEERARIESESDRDASFLNRTFSGPMEEFAGSRRLFGDLTVRDVRNLDLSTPLSDDLSLALELALQTETYDPKFVESEGAHAELEKLFDPLFRRQMKPLSDALNENFSEKDVYPSDVKSLREILRSQKIVFDAQRDPWGNQLRADFSIDGKFQKMNIWSAGADEVADTADDLSVLQGEWPFFTPMGKLIEKIAVDYTKRTDVFITDYETLRKEMLRKEIDLAALRDPHGKQYRFEYSIERGNYVLRVFSEDPGKRTTIGGKPQEILVWETSVEYFTATRAKLIRAFNDYAQKQNSFPRNEAEITAAFAASGFAIDQFKDAFNRPYFIKEQAKSNFATAFRNTDNGLIAVEQKIVTFSLRSSGQDGIKDNLDDFEVASFVGLTSETKTKVDAPMITRGRALLKNKPLDTKTGRFHLTVTDANGAVITGAVVKLSNKTGTFSKIKATGEDGEVDFSDLPTDFYSVVASAPNFRTRVITNLPISAGVLLDFSMALDIGEVQTMVDVTGSEMVMIETSSSSIVGNSVTRSRSNGAGIPRTFTPRVRSSFAETLFWSPEILTDKNGDAQFDFKMADSLTTWKMYIVASDEEGNVGIAEKELNSFQPFFAELDPPRILTEGDRIALPVPVRNYTDKKKKVAVSLAPNEWSRQFGGAQNLEVAANSTANAVFDFQATAAVRDGKQKVTAVAKNDGDAVEKPVTVRPNGKEIVATQSAIYDRDGAFDVNFPDNALPNARSAELKIYPNMLAHVAESADGLLERPHGCGEQTTSSTYPNLMILRIEKELGRAIDPAVKSRAQAYLNEGYKRLLNYQTDSGGFSYWGKSDAPRAALTAYVLRFLNDADAFIDVDKNVVRRAQEWLIKQQGNDGRWEVNDATTAFVLRALSVDADPALRESLRASIRRFGSYTDLKDPYVLANIALAAQRTGDDEIATNSVARLRALASAGDQTWSTEETSFYGWGEAANIETTALVLQAMLGEMAANPDALTAKDRETVSKALLFILKMKDRYGVWNSTQTTVNVLDALILLQQNNKANGVQKAEIFINGKKAREVEFTGFGVNKPVFFDVSPFLSGSENRVEIRSAGSIDVTSAQIVARHYIDWRDAKPESNEFEMSANFDKTEARIGEEITCRVSANRRSSRNGMVLIEIGLPPGADVDRASLQKARSVVSSFEIQPDRVVIYSWLGAEQTNFEFKFRPRFGMNAQTKPSRIYDYYNDAASQTIVPVRFVVK